MDLTRRDHPSLRTHLIGMLALFAGLFLCLAAYLYHASRALFIEALEHELAGDIDWMGSILASEPGMNPLTHASKADSLCKAIASRKGFRVSVIDSSGRVLGESHVPGRDVAGIENHFHRPEMVKARKDGWGSARRYSSTVRMEMLYLARYVPAGGYYLRMAAAPHVLRQFQLAALKVLGVFLALFLGAAAVITLWISRAISTPLLHISGGDLENAPPADRGGRALASLRTLQPPRWEARFREADVLNRAFEGYAGEIRQLAGEIARERDKLVAILNQLEEGILILGADLAVVAANPSSLRLLGLNDPSHPGGGSGATVPSSLFGKAFAGLAHQDSLVAWVAEASDPHRPAVLHLERGPGTPFDLLCHLGELQGENGEREYLLTLVDVTEFRHLDRVKSEFVANASHELKTPLSSIKGFAEALLEGALEDAKVREPFVRKIHNNALRLERLVQDLLHLSQLEANPSPKESEPLPLRGYVNAACNLHRQGLDAAGIRLENSVPEDVRILMEPRDLELILNNLIGNAIKYNRPAGKVKVALERVGEGVRLGVRDTGIGIPEDMLPRIFERFYRHDAARSSKDGTGLGLAIVKHAAQKYGMTVKAESVLGEGSRFSLEIPPSLLAQAGNP